MEPVEAKLVDQPFTIGLPKVELHAHLTGSVSRQTLRKLWLEKVAQDPSLDLEDPATAIPSSANGIDITTFFPIFDKYIYNLISTAADIRTATLSVLQDFALDGVAYLELRTTPRAIPAAGITKADYVALVLSAIATHNSAQSALRTRLIMSIDRRSSAEDAAKVVELALEHRATSSHGSDRGGDVVGVDLCGNPLRGSVSTFAAAFAAAREGGLRITLHFGEVAAAGGSAAEVETLLGFWPQRLGHVIHVPSERESWVKEEIVRRRLGVELCLSCNVLAKMTKGGFEGHHFEEWRGSGCPVALSTDDVGIFESSLSNEYLLASRSFPSLGRKELVDLSRGAVTCIFGGEEEKGRLYRLLDDFERRQGLC